MNSLLEYKERMIFGLRDIYHRFGYIPYKMSRFEAYDLYVRNKDFLVSDQIITFSDDRGRLLALKPDVTLSIVKNAPETPGVVQKVYYNENVYRDYREIMQAGLECVGDVGAYEIAEVLMLAVRSLQMIQARSVLNLSHMGLVAAVLDNCELDAAGKKRAMECLRQKNAHEIRSLCEANETAARKLEMLVECRGGSLVLDQLAAVLTGEKERQALGELRNLMRILETNGLHDHVCIDFSVANDMRYYNGVVFRGYADGIPTSILSGGQYDRLLRKMGKKCRAIGFAIYVDLLQELAATEQMTDVDTVILHDGTVDVEVLLSAAKTAEESGSVLVTRTLPGGRNWKNLLRFEKGKAVAE